MTLAPTFGVPGIIVNAHGAGYPANQPISVQWDGVPVAGGNSPSQRIGFDPEDRQLPGDAITWISSLDGELGTGSELTVDDLSTGTHVITALATDSDGLTDSISFELEVDGSVVQPLPDPAVVSAMDTIFAAVGAGEDPAAAYQDATGADLTPWLILGLLLAGGAAVGGGLWWRSRSGHTLE